MDLELMLIVNMDGVVVNMIIYDIVELISCVKPKLVLEVLVRPLFPGACVKVRATVAHSLLLRTFQNWRKCET